SGAVQTAAAAAIVTGLLHQAVTRLRGPAIHAHCDTCRLCSIAGGVAPTRNPRRSQDNLTAAGWRTTPGGRATCPGCAAGKDPR
ncbi:MAG TPA: hypothetical protein VJT31_28025, partial [Rugosimonospora sp.]|nr:hypothetical protein [Rugosimonospora sp.]